VVSIYANLVGHEIKSFDKINKKTMGGSRYGEGEV
jgi:hypothetical protein